MSVTRRVRFEEVDALGIVWHGHYPSYFDDARVALGDAYGMGYLDFLDHEVVTPIRKIHVDYLEPLSYPGSAEIEAILHWTEAARINYEFIVRSDEGRVHATGYTVQMLLDKQRQVMITPPPFLIKVRERWRRGELEADRAAESSPSLLARRIPQR